MSESPATDAAVIAMLGQAPEGGAENEDPEGQEPEASGAEEGQEPGSIDDLPDWAAEEIRRLRRENASARVNARRTARKPATEQPPSESSQQAIRAAEERGRRAATLENGIRLARAEVRAALTGVVSAEQTESVLDNLNLAHLVDDSGEVDAEAIASLKDTFTSISGPRSTPRVSHGRQTQATPAKSTADAFAEAVGAAFQ